MIKTLISLVLIAGLGGGGYWLWKQSATNHSRDAKPARATTATVESRDIQFAVNAAGDIGPADQVSVRSEINGRIVELPVDIGDKVAKGQLLCRLDDKDLQTERGQRLTEIDGARLELQKANRNYDRTRRLFEQNLTPQETFDDAKTTFDLATNALERTEKALRLVEDRLSKSKILAPFDCTVLLRPVSLGQTVSGAAGFNSGTEIMSIANLNDMIINAHINQVDVVRLSTGQVVEVQVESVPGLQMKGVLERIAPQAVIKNGIKGFAARVALKDIDPRIRPGMTAILSIPVESAADVLAVPLAAVFTENDGERYVFVRKDDERFERRAVVVGVTDYSHAEIRSGLTAGEVVSLEQTVPGQDPHASPGSNAPMRKPAARAAASPKTTAVKGTASAPAPAPTPAAVSRPSTRGSGS